MSDSNNPKDKLNEKNRLNSQYQRNWVDFLLMALDWKVIAVLGLLVSGTGMAFGLGVLKVPKIVWGETELVVAGSVLGTLLISSWFIILPMMKLNSQRFDLLVKINAEHDQIMDIWLMHPSRTSKIEVEDGSAYQRILRGVSCYFVRDYDSNKKIAEGVWMGESNDVELMTAREEIRKNRGRLRRWAQIGHQLYSSLPAISQSIESDYWRSMTDDSIDRIAAKPDVVSDSVVSEVEQLVESVERPDEADAEEIAEERVQETVDGNIPNNE
jgi:hypothetical protein